MIILRFADKITAQKIHNKDVQAFEELINKFKSKIFNYCFHIVNNYHTAEEVTQEVFIKVYTNIESYDPKKAALSTWIFTIAHNTCINSLRNNKKDVSVEEIEVSQTNASLEEKVFMDDCLNKLVQALESLPPKDKSLIILKDYLGLKNNEISIILGIPEGTVKSGLHNARIKIRKMVGDIDD